VEQFRLVAKVVLDLFRDLSHGDVLVALAYKQFPGGLKPARRRSALRRLALSFIIGSYPAYSGRPGWRCHDVESQRCVMREIAFSRTRYQANFRVADHPATVAKASGVKMISPLTLSAVTSSSPARPWTAGLFRLTAYANPSERSRRPAGSYPRLEPRHKRRPWFHGREPIAS
jgi:hypothetical protein